MGPWPTVVLLTHQWLPVTGSRQRLVAWLPFNGNGCYWLLLVQDHLQAVTRQKCTECPPHIESGYLKSGFLHYTGGSSQLPSLPTPRVCNVTNMQRTLYTIHVCTASVTDLLEGRDRPQTCIHTTDKATMFVTAQLVACSRPVHTVTIPAQ